MLTKIQIEGFKAIKQSGSIGLGPLTLLIGRNGSGKSSLIEALQWLQEAVILGLRDATQRRFVSFGALLNRRSESESALIALDLVHGVGVREVRYMVRTKAGKLSPVVQSERCREGRTSGAQWTIRSRKGSKGPAVRSIAGGNPVRVACWKTSPFTARPSIFSLITKRIQRHHGARGVPRVAVSTSCTWILKHAEDGAKLFQHPIADRLRTILA